MLGGHLGVFGDLLDIHHGFGLGVVLDELDELFLGVLDGEARDAFQFLRLFLVDVVKFSLALVDGFLLRGQLVLQGLHFLALALDLFHLLVGLLLHLVHLVLGLLQLTLALVASFLVLVFHLQEFLLGLEDAFFLDDLGFFLGFIKVCVGFLGYGFFK